MGSLVSSKKIVSFLLVFFTFSFMAFVSHQNAVTSCAQTERWTCCKPGPDGEATDQCDGVCRTAETKNEGDSCGGKPETECYVCRGEFTKSNRCGGTSGSSLCLYEGSTPSPVNLKVGEAIEIRSSYWAYGPIGELRWNSQNATVATTNPTIRNVCCGWLYGRQTWPTVIEAKAEGTANVLARAFGRDNKALSCSGNIPVKVQGVATPLTCVPGAKCTVTGTTTKTVSCTMPAAPLASGEQVYNYYMDCKPDVTGVSAVSQTKKTPNFSFTAAKSSTLSKYSCSFKYCTINSTTKIIKCSDWGSAV